MRGVTTIFPPRPEICLDLIFMTNTIAIWLGVLILCVIAVDFLFLDAAGLVFLGKDLIHILDKMAFWR
ncbi:hypothetical protein FZCC0069_05880 [Rhodobacterales bacterium FZCC0069]|nr:hypothetical protein [Rhodobacterales bacterium FZCC0069]